MKHQSKIFDISKEELQRLYDESNTFYDLSKKIGISNYTTIRKALKEKGIDYSRLQSIIRIKHNLTGETFGYLNVLGVDNEKKGTGKIYWKCICKCGKEISVSTESLRSGTSTSCGCKRIENAIKSRKKYNKYDLSGSYGIGWTNNTNIMFYFDKEDFDKIKEYTWQESSGGYIITTINHKKVQLHRLITSCKSNMEIDHINHNTADNRKINLRECNRFENARNRGLQSNNTTGCTGVGFIKSSNKWRARIKIQGKEIHLGNFKNYEDAVKARKQAEIKYYGDYRYKGE